MFQFDEARRRNHPRAASEHSQEEDSQSESDDEDGIYMSSRSNSNVNLELSKSPPMAIPPRSGTSPTPAPVKGIVGSFKGKPFSMPSVNEEVHAKAAAMGKMESYVGSMSGRTGVDASNPQSYQDSLKQRSGGVPKTMSERLAMENLAEEDAEDEL